MKPNDMKVINLYRKDVELLIHELVSGDSNSDVISYVQNIYYGDENEDES